MQNVFFERAVDKALDDLKEVYERLCAENTSLRDKLASYRKDAEIAAMEQELHTLRNNSLHVFSGKEREEYRAFRDRHYESCKSKSYIIELSGTGIGECISVQCPVCGEKADITDTSDW